MEKTIYPYTAPEITSAEVCFESGIAMSPQGNTEGFIEETT